MITSKKLEVFWITRCDQDHLEAMVKDIKARNLCWYDDSDVECDSDGEFDVVVAGERPEMKLYLKEVIGLSQADIDDELQSMTPGIEKKLQSLYFE